MTPETQHSAAAELRAIALELGAMQDAYLQATSAAFHAFSALKAANALADRLNPSVAINVLMPGESLSETVNGDGKP